MSETSTESNPNHTDVMIEFARKLLKGVKKPQQGQGEPKGRLTKTRLRNILAIATIAKNEESFKAFELRFRYLIARNVSNREHELEIFAKNALKVFAELNGDLERINKVLKYAIMIYTAMGVFDDNDQ